MIHTVIGGRSLPAAANDGRDLIDPATGSVHGVATVRPRDDDRTADLDRPAGPPGHAKVVAGGNEAVALANGVEQGLTASVWTRSLGFGSSGYGKDLGMYGLDDYTRIKHVAHAL